MLDLMTLAIEAGIAGETQVLSICEEARRGNEFALRAAKTWMRWALVRRELRLTKVAREAA